MKWTFFALNKGKLLLQKKNLKKGIILESSRKCANGLFSPNIQFC